MEENRFSYIIGIVTYNPQIERLAQCVRKAAGNHQKLVIVDNGSSNIESIKGILGDIQTASLIENKTNCGIAKALNQIFRLAKQQGYEWVLTLDQDTIIPDNLLERYKQAICENGMQLAVLCPQIHDDATNITWPTLANDETGRYVERCITSASLNRVEMWERTGGFDERLFIDEVDHDYCYRVRKEGGNILLVNGAAIHHTIGNSKVYSVFGKKIVVRNHSAFRKYYITRNILLVDRKQNGKITFSALRHCVLFSIKTLLFEDNKVKKLLACMKGLADGVKGV